MIQRRAARYVTWRYMRKDSPTEMMRLIGWNNTLEERRERQRLIMFYNFHHKLAAFNHSPYMFRTSNPYLQHVHYLDYTVPGFTKAADYLKNTFFPCTAYEWNNLTEDVVSAPTLDDFKSQLGMAPLAGPHN